MRKKLLVVLAIVIGPPIFGHVIAPSDHTQGKLPAADSAIVAKASEYETLTGEFFQEVIDLSMMEHCGFIKAGGQLLSARWQVLQSNFLTHHGYMPKGIEHFTEDFERARRNGNELGADPSICAAIDRQHIADVRRQISTLTGIPEQALHR